MSGLPVVAAPVLLIYAVEQGEAFAATAARSAVLGIVSSVAFCVAYAATALRTGPAGALVAAWLAFAASTAVLSALDPPLALNAAVALATVLGGSVLLGRMAPGAAPARPASDLLAWRLVITAALVLALTAAAGSLSAHLAGLLVPLPVITAVMAGFTHARAGAGAAIELLGGLVTALVSFWVFFVVAAALLPDAGGAAAFAPATVAALSVWAAMAARSAARPAPARRPPPRAPRA